MKNETHAEWLARVNANLARLEASNHYVYRAYDEAGRLLYIGCTVNLPGRMNQHRHSAQWWEFVASMSVETFPTRSAGREAESRAIQTENSYFNRFPGNQFTANTPAAVGIEAYQAARKGDVAA